MGMDEIDILESHGIFGMGKLMDHWIGLRENLNRKLRKPMGFYHEIWENLRLKFSLKPTQ